MKNHMPLIGGTLLMVVPTLMFVGAVLNFSVPFGAFALMLGVCILCLVAGANIAIG